MAGPSPEGPCGCHLQHGVIIESALRAAGSLLRRTETEERGSQPPAHTRHPRPVTPPCQARAPQTTSRRPFCLGL